MKNFSLINKKKLIGGTFVLLLSVVIFGCREDLTESEFVESGLKSGTVTVPMNGVIEGAEYEIVLPEYWNVLSDKVLIVYAHGMVDPQPYEDVVLPDDFIADKSVKDIVLSMGGYAATSYRDNGLVVLDAVKDIKNLRERIDEFFASTNEYYPPDFVFLGGPSEGGLVTTLTIEKYPNLFDGAISICGPIGNFYRQLQYNGDFHVLLNYFFKDELLAKGIDLGNPQDGIDPFVMSAWKSGALPLAIADIFINNPGKTHELVKCAKVPVDLVSQEVVIKSLVELLRFNVMLTNDVNSRLGGIPFNNRRKWYVGSSNDWKLNRHVQRISGPNFHQAKTNIKKYETTGNIEIPIVTIHTIGDHITPFWHNPIYRRKVFMKRNRRLHTGIPVINYGHCTIQESHIMAGLAILLTKCKLINSFRMPAYYNMNTQEIDSFIKILKENSIHVKFED